MKMPSEEDMARDLAANLALCDAATPPPWSWEDDPPTLYSGRTEMMHGLNLLGRLGPDRNGKANLDFICAARDGWPAAIRRAMHAEAEVARLIAAIRGHHAQKADDRCIEDDDRLYAAAGLPPCDRRVGDKAAMLRNCERFIDRRCEGGHWPSYAELEGRIAALTAALESIFARCEDWSAADVRAAVADALGRPADGPEGGVG